MFTEEIRNKLQTGDLILCSGNGIASKAIIAFNKAQRIKELLQDDSVNPLDILGMLKGDLSLELSHLALVVKVTDEMLLMNNWLDKFFPCGAGLYVFESTTGNEKWSGIRGVQINPFDDFLHQYDGDIWARLLDTDTDSISMEVIESMVQMLGMDYEDGIPGMFELMLIFNEDIRIDTPEPHCTEAGVVVLKKNGLCVEETDEHKLPPCKFGNGGKFEHFATCVIGDMLKIKDGS